MPTALNAGHGRSKVIEREVEDHRDAYRNRLGGYKACIKTFEQ